MTWILGFYDDNFSWFWKFLYCVGNINLTLTWVGKWAIQWDVSGFIILNNYILFTCELDYNMVLEITLLQCKIHKHLELYVRILQTLEISGSNCDRVVAVSGPALDGSEHMLFPSLMNVNPKCKQMETIRAKTWDGASGHRGCWLTGFHTESLSQGWFWTTLELFIEQQTYPAFLAW